MGGTNDPSNLIEVTREQHAELHFALYLKHNKIQDWVAFNMLSGQTEEGERARRQMCSEQMQGNTRGKANKGRKNPWNAAANKARPPTQWITDGLHSTQLPKSQAIPEGWRKGRLMSAETKRKMSVSARNRRPK